MDIFSNATIIFFIANSLYVVSYLVTSMLWLRILAIIAAISTFPYFFFQVEPLWSALFWQCAFLLVNLINLIVLVVSMRTPEFDEFEASAYKLKFSGMKPHEAVPLFKAAHRRDLNSGDQLLREGQQNDALFLIVNGRCKVVKDGIDVATLKVGNFVGEISFSSGEPGSADVYCDSDVELMYWNTASMTRLNRKNVLYASYLHQLCNADLSAKLKRMTIASSDNMAGVESWLLDGE